MALAAYSGDAAFFRVLGLQSSLLGLSPVKAPEPGVYPQLRAIGLAFRQG